MVYEGEHYRQIGVTLAVGSTRGWSVYRKGQRRCWWNYAGGCRTVVLIMSKASVIATFSITRRLRLTYHVILYGERAKQRLCDGCSEEVVPRDPLACFNWPGGLRGHDLSSWT